MTIATGSRSQVAFITETAFGTTPAIPQLVRIPFSQWNVNLTRDEYDDMSIQADRMQRFSVSGNRHVIGDMDVNYQPLNYDTLLESVCFSSFTANVLKIGQTLKSMTFEEGQLDIVQFRTFTGVIVDKFSLTVPNAGVITAKFSLVGKDQSTLGVATISTAPATAPVVEPAMTHTGTSGFFKLGGAVVGYITSMALTIDNGVGQNFGLGVGTVRAFSPGFAKITGTATVFFEDSIAYNLFVSGTASSLDFKLDNGVNQHEFNLPNVKFVSATKAVTGQGPITMSFAFKSLYDVTSASNIIVTRS